MSTDIPKEVMEYHSLPTSLMMSIGGWSTAYLLIKKLSNKEPEWAVRFLTTIHATVITVMAILDWTLIKDWNIEQLGEVNSRYEEQVLCITLGYFIFDVIWIIKYQTEGPAMYCHHFASILCLLVILIKGVSASEVLVGISGLELTNPCLQARWFLRTYGYHGSWIYTITEIIFMTTFVVFRLFYGTYLSYNIITHPKCNLVLKIGTVCLYVVSWAFACQMFSYVTKRYLKKYDKED